jgi:hypothetical protein
MMFSISIVISIGENIMAFAKASGYTNLNQGNFSPEIFSKQAQLAFRKSAVINAITNNDYFGDISGQGDSVRILKEPDITVNVLARGTATATQDLVDADFKLTIDKANYFAFKLDDIEEAHSHVDFMRLSTDRAAYKMADAMDNDVLKYLAGFTTGNAVNSTVNGTIANAAAGTDELLAANKLKKSDFANITTTSAADHSIPLAPRLTGATAVSTATATPLQVLSRMSRRLDEQDVDSRGRWVVLDPVMVEMLKDEDSRLLNADFGGSGLMNGLLAANIHGFRVYQSNNLPKVGTGPGTAGTANQNTNYGVIVAGHDSAVATAEQLSKVETYRDPDSFADICRGMHLYGRKILRSEAIITAKYNAA